MVLYKYSSFPFYHAQNNHIEHHMQNYLVLTSLCTGWAFKWYC